MKKLSIAFSLAAAFVLSACAGTGGSSEAAVNRRCPMMTEEGADPGVTVDYKGQKVAFCCEDCIDGWNDLGDDEKAARLEAVR